MHFNESYLTVEVDYIFVMRLAPCKIKTISWNLVLQSFLYENRIKRKGPVRDEKFIIAFIVRRFFSVNVAMNKSLKRNYYELFCCVRMTLDTTHGFKKF